MGSLRSNKCEKEGKTGRAIGLAPSPSQIKNEAVLLPLSHPRPLPPLLLPRFISFSLVSSFSTYSSIQNLKLTPSLSFFSALSRSRASSDVCFLPSSFPSSSFYLTHAGSIMLSTLPLVAALAALAPVQAAVVEHFWFVVFSFPPLPRSVSPFSGGAWISNSSLPFC